MILQLKDTGYFLQYDCCVVYKCHMCAFIMLWSADKFSQVLLDFVGVRMTNLITEGGVSKQKTISGLFEKIKTKSDVDQSMSGNESHDPDPPLERFKDKEHSSSTISKCNQDTFYTQVSSKDIDPCKMLFHSHMEVNSADSCITESSVVKTPIQSDPRHNMDTSSSDSFVKQEEQHIECSDSMTSVGIDDQAETKQHSVSNKSAKNQPKLSLFSYISHSRTDYDQLSKSVFWKNCMTDKRFCGYTWHEAKNMVQESNSESDNKETLREGLCVADPADDEKLIQIKEEYNVKDPRDIITCFSDPVPCKNKSGSPSNKSCDPDAIKVEDEREKPEFHRTGLSSQQVECQKYECPVCNRSLYFKNLDKFTEHIDDCLVQRCVTDEQKAIQLESGDHGKTSKSNRQSSEKVSDSRKEHSHQSVGELELCIPSTSTDYEDILICPVCNAPQRKSNVILFNQHVDACLNRQTIKEMVQESRPTVKRLVVLYV